MSMMKEVHIYEGEYDMEGDIFEDFPSAEIKNIQIVKVDYITGQKTYRFEILQDIHKESLIEKMRK